MSEELTHPPGAGERRNLATVTRRGVVSGFGAAALTGLTTGAYAVGIEPQRLAVTNYALSPERWRGGPRLRIVVLADIHACTPWMSLAHVEDIVARANALQADLTVLLGDYVAGMHVPFGEVPVTDWARALGRLSAPLGVHAVLGNHDWWETPDVRRARGGKALARVVLEDVGIPVYENEAVRIEKDGRAFWLAGLGDQLVVDPYLAAARGQRGGVDDLPKTLAQIPDGAPAILLAHEPDIFPQVPARVALTLCGHTHGGQVRFFGYSPIVPSRFRNRYAYGHVREQTDLIVSGGLGCSIFPMRLGMPPEIVVVELSAP